MVGQVCTPSMSHCHNHHTYRSNTKIVGRNFLPWELGSCQTKITGCELTIIASLATANSMTTQKDKANRTTKHVSLVANSCLMKECGMTFLVEEECMTLRASTQFSSATGYPHNEDEIWQMANAKVEGTTPSKILEIKNNSPEPVNIILIPNPDAFFNIETNPEDFHEHYQNLAPTREEQKEWLCDLIYNLLIHMIYMIPEEKEPISSCALESESPFNSNSNFDNDDDKNTGSSSVQIGDNNNNDSNSDSNSDPKYEQYITLPDLFKEQKLKWYNDNNEGIMPECAHDTNARFNLRYLGKDPIKLEPHSHTCIDLKVALEIPTTTMIQLVFRSSLTKRGINIRRGIIDAGYVGNIIAMLQNDSEKAYIIEPNEKIAQAIFLPLVKIAQLILVGNREELGITVRGIQGFGSMNRIDVPVNMAEKEIIDQEEIISMGQAISILLYGQYIVEIK
ncbi:hypothetical protein G9A89_021650 [Geosiphon pyriformis]|nr:hypothetical protein G9A89_021650 [Geosiphon pyriformis]